MNLIKENIFYSTLIGILVVVGGGLVAMGFVGGSGTDDKEAVLVKASKDVARIRTGIMVNATVRAHKEREVTLTKRLYSNVATDAAGWNKEDYPAVVVDKIRARKKIGDMKLFPIVRQDYIDYDASFMGSSKIRKLTADLFASLHPTTPPTNDEVDAEVARLRDAAAEKLRQKLLKEAWEKRADDIDRQGTEGEGEGETEIDPGIGGVGTPFRPGVAPGAVVIPDTGAERDRERSELEGRDGVGAPVIEVDYDKHGLDNIRLFKAGLHVKGLPAEPKEVSIYVDETNVIAPVFATAISGAKDTELWNAQTQLWILGDIVNAIAKVNDLSLKADRVATPAKRTVAASAIKRLVTVSIPSGYVTGSGDDEFGLDSSRMGTTGANLTGRVTNKKHDVKHYSFTVVMNTQYLPELRRILLLGNHHTILNESLRAIVPPANSVNEYYFGTGAVMEVTIEGELLMLADWTRGMWEDESGSTVSSAGSTNSTGSAGSPPPPSSSRGRPPMRRQPGSIDTTTTTRKGKWKAGFEPLMPVDVLKEIYRQDPGALRDVDIQRMNETTK